MQDRIIEITHMACADIIQICNEADGDSPLLLATIMAAQCAAASYMAFVAQNNCPGMRDFVEEEFVKDYRSLCNATSKK